MKTSPVPPTSGKTIPLCALAILVLALGVASCAAPSKRIADEACEFCYRTDSGVRYKTWEAYDP